MQIISKSLAKLLEAPGLILCEAANHLWVHQGLFFLLIQVAEHISALKSSMWEAAGLAGRGAGAGWPARHRFPRATLSKAMFPFSHRHSVPFKPHWAPGGVKTPLQWLWSSSAGQRCSEDVTAIPLAGVSWNNSCQPHDENRMEEPCEQQAAVSTPKTLLWNKAVSKSCSGCVWCCELWFSGY